MKGVTGQFDVLDPANHICPPFTLSARKSLVCLLHLTSLPDYKPFPINLCGPQSFPPMRSAIGRMIMKKQNCFFVSGKYIFIFNQQTGPC